MDSISQQDMCKCLRLIKQKLPHRSLELTLKQLYKIVINNQYLPSKLAIEESQLFYQSEEYKAKQEQDIDTHCDLQKHYQINELKFPYPQEEMKYKYMRMIGASFVKNGPGYKKCKSYFLQHNQHVVLHRNKYQNLLTAVLSLTVRLLETHLREQCQRVFKPFDRNVIRGNMIYFIDAMKYLGEEKCNTFYQFIEAALGLEEVTIKHEDALQLYLKWGTLIYGQNMSLQQFERIGKIHKQRKEEQLMRYYKIKGIDPVTKQPLKEPQKREERNDKHIKKEEQIFVQKLRTQGKSIMKNQYGIDVRVKLQFDQFWKPSRDKQLIEDYLQYLDYQKCIEMFRKKYPCFVKSLTYINIKNRFIKLLKRSIKRIQIQSQREGNNCLQKINRQEMLYILKHNKTEMIRRRLFYFFIQNNSSEKLNQIVNQIKQVLLQMRKQQMLKKQIQQYILEQISIEINDQID